LATALSILVAEADWIGKNLGVMTSLDILGHHGGSTTHRDLARGSNHPGLLLLPLLFKVILRLVRFPEVR
jgi:hypothetical protein